MATKINKRPSNEVVAEAPPEESFEVLAEKPSGSGDAQAPIKPPVLVIIDY